MSEIQNSKRYDLEERTLMFARHVRNFVSRLSKTTANQEDGRQLIRSSGSVGSNYIEANEALGKKDFALHIRISRKEAKESAFWLQLVDTAGVGELDKERDGLTREAHELTSIFGSVLKKTL